MKDEWQLEMDRMLDIFQHESESSLRKINRRFEVLGRPFNDEFRQHFKKMTAHRLDSSFTKIEMERWNNGQVQNSEGDDRKITSNCITSATASTSRATTNAQLSKNGDDIHLIVKSENLIEISDSDDEYDAIKSVGPNETQNTNTVEKNVSATKNQNDERGSDGRRVETRLNSSNQEDQTLGSNGEGSKAQNDEDIEPNAPIKDENSNSNDVEFMDEVEDIPLVTFDPNQGNDQFGTTNGSLTQQSSTSQMTVNQSKHIIYRFECEHCERKFRNKTILKNHQRVHANAELLGLKADSNGLYHCTLCIRQFTDLCYLSRHMKGSHVDDQYLYDCARCMWQFVRKADKDKHESLCDGYHFECHLCKVFIARYKSQMQTHMRTHSGLKPFHCMICSKCFTTKGHLEKHLNTIHNRINT